MYIIFFLFFFVVVHTRKMAKDLNHSSSITLGKIQVREFRCLDHEEKRLQN